jgi:hypothetical protein
VKPDSVGDQRHADEDQEAQRQELDRKVGVHETAQGLRGQQHDGDGDDDGRRHHRQMLRHPDGRDDAVQGKHDVQDENLGDGRPEAGNAGLADLLLDPFHGGVDLHGSLGQQEEPSGRKDDVAQGDGMSEHGEKRPCKPRHPRDAGEQQQPGDHRQPQAGTSRAALLGRRQAVGHEGDEDQVVDAQDDFQGGQGQKTGPEARVEQDFHGVFPPCSPVGGGYYRRRGRKPRCMAVTATTSPIPTASNTGLG